MRRIVKNLYIGIVLLFWGIVLPLSAQVCTVTGIVRDGNGGTNTAGQIIKRGLSTADGYLISTVLQKDTVRAGGVLTMRMMRKSYYLIYGDIGNVKANGSLIRVPDSATADIYTLLAQTWTAPPGYVVVGVPLLDSSRMSSLFHCDSLFAQGGGGTGNINSDSLTFDIRRRAAQKRYDDSLYEIAWKASYIFNTVYGQPFAYGDWPYSDPQDSLGNYNIITFPWWSRLDTADCQGMGHVEYFHSWEAWLHCTYKNIAIYTNIFPNLDNTLGKINYKTQDLNTLNFNYRYGAHSLDSVTTGNYNSALGEGNLQYLTTGNYNSAVGLQNFPRLINGNTNIAGGYDNGSTMTTGSRNILFGHHVYHAGNGDDNIGMGEGTLFRCTGSRNIGIGKYAGWSAGGNDKIYIASDSTNIGLYIDFITGKFVFNTSFGCCPQDTTITGTVDSLYNFNRRVSLPVANRRGNTVGGMTLDGGIVAKGNITARNLAIDTVTTHTIFSADQIDFGTGTTPTQNWKGVRIFNASPLTSAVISLTNEVGNKVELIEQAYGGGGRIGTVTNDMLEFYTNNTQAGQFTATGDFKINKMVTIGTDSLAGWDNTGKFIKVHVSSGATDQTARDTASAANKQANTAIGLFVNYLTIAAFHDTSMNFILGKYFALADTNTYYKSKLNQAAFHDTSMQWRESQIKSNTDTITSGNIVRAGALTTGLGTKRDISDTLTPGGTSTVITMTQNIRDSLALVFGSGPRKYPLSKLPPGTLGQVIKTTAGGNVTWAADSAVDISAKADTANPIATDTIVFTRLANDSIQAWKCVGKLYSSFFGKLWANDTISLSGMVNGQIINIEIENENAYTFTWKDAIKWSGGTAPTQTAVAGKQDIYTVIKLRNELHGSVVQNF